MTRRKPETPYARLLRECRQWAFTVEYPKRRTMFVFPKSKLREGWSLDDVAQRVQAAKTLGWRVEIVVAENGDLVTQYVREPDDAPWAIRP